MGRGRPIGFDRDAALDRALEHFYAHGYQGSGMTDLIEHMGIARQSLYSAFGDKRGLFLEAVERYGNMQADILRGILNQPGSPLANLKAMLQFVGSVAGDPLRPGCLVGNTIAELGDIDEEMKTQLEAHFENITNEVQRTLIRAKDAGELPRGLNVRAIANTFCCIVQGLFIATKLEPDPQMIQDVIDTATSLIA